MISGTFKFSKGMERKVQVPHCEQYRLKLSVKSGVLKVYLGGSDLGVKVTGEYDSIHEWVYAPYIRLIGLEGDTEALLYGEVIEP